jgi:hypothetical protein
MTRPTSFVYKAPRMGSSDAKALAVLRDIFETCTKVASMPDPNRRLLAIAKLAHRAIREATDERSEEASS